MTGWKRSWAAVRNRGLSYRFLLATVVNPGFFRADCFTWLCSRITGQVTHAYVGHHIRPLVWIATVPNTPPTACLKCSCAPCVCKPEAPRPVEQISRIANNAWAHLYLRSRWRHPNTGLRAATLRRDIICVVCKRAPSEVADHIKDHRGDEKLFWDPNNLRGVCKPCHDEKTGSQHGPNRKPKPLPHLVNGLIANQQ